MGEPPSTPDLGVKLKRLRLARGLTAVAAAKATGISKSHLWNLENKASNPSRELLLRIASVYGTGVADLVGEDPDASTEEPRMVAIFRDLKGLSERDLSTVEALIAQFKSK